MLSEELKEILRERFTNNFDLASEDLNAIFANAYLKTVKKGDIFYSGNDCFGFILILKGVLRAFVSSNVKEITIFRLTKDESCVLCDTKLSKIARSSLFRREFTNLLKKNIRAF